MTSSLRAVILDYGDVISLPADPAVMSWMAALFQVPLGRFRHTYGQFRHDYDLGALKAEEYWRKIGEANGVTLDGDQITQLREADVKMWGRLNPAILEWAKELRLAGFKTAVLSNMHHDMVQHIRAQDQWKECFDVLTLSSAIGMAKPEPEIFEYCLKQLNVSAGEALFIDDRDCNIDGALRVGISGIVAPTPEALVDMLDTIGFFPVPEV
jgi:putative hydrolase of the HAD superfamily